MAYFTIKLPIPQQDPKTKIGLTNKKIKLIEDLFQAQNEIANEHWRIVQETGREDESFHHSLVYKKYREKYPFVSSSSFGQIRRNVLSIAKQQKDCPSLFPVFFSPSETKFFTPSKPDRYSLFVKFGKDLIIPFVDKRAYEKIKEFGLLPEEVKVDSSDVQCIKMLQEAEQKNPQKCYSLKNIKNRYNSNGYKLVRVFLARKEHGRLFIYLTLEKREVADFDSGGHTIDQRSVKVESHFSEPNPEGMCKSQPKPPKQLHSVTVFTVATVLPNLRHRKAPPKPVLSLRIPKWGKTDDVPYSQRRKMRPGLIEELRVSSSLKTWVPKWLDMAPDWDNNDIGSIRDFVASVPVRNLLLDPKDGFKNLRLYNAKLAEKGFEAISLTKTIFV